MGGIVRAIAPPGQPVAARAVRLASRCRRPPVRSRSRSRRSARWLRCLPTALVSPLDQAVVRAFRRTLGRQRGPGGRAGRGDSTGRADHPRRARCRVPAHARRRRVRGRSGEQAGGGSVRPRRRRLSGARLAGDPRPRRRGGDMGSRARVGAFTAAVLRGRVDRRRAEGDGQLRGFDLPLSGGPFGGRRATGGDGCAAVATRGG
jgi:hypothetical protein